MILRNMNGNVSGRQMTMKVKITRSGTLGGYRVTGWRYLEDASWHVKVWLAARPGDWMGYTVTDGEFELKTGAKTHKETVLHVITEWEAELVVLPGLP
jgi:hypothetical protein